MYGIEVDVDPLSDFPELTLMQDNRRLARGESATAQPEKAATGLKMEFNMNPIGFYDIFYDIFFRHIDEALLSTLRCSSRPKATLLSPIIIIDPVPA